MQCTSWLFGSCWVRFILLMGQMAAMITQVASHLVQHVHMISITTCEKGAYCYKECSISLPVKDAQQLLQSLTFPLAALRARVYTLLEQEEQKQNLSKVDWPTGTATYLGYSVSLPPASSCISHTRSGLITACYMLSHLPVYDSIKVTKHADRPNNRPSCRALSLRCTAPIQHI